MDGSVDTGMLEEHGPSSPVDEPCGANVKRHEAGSSRLNGMIHGSREAGGGRGRVRIAISSPEILAHIRHEFASKGLDVQIDGLPSVDVVVTPGDRRRAGDGCTRRRPQRPRRTAHPAPGSGHGPLPVGADSASRPAPRTALRNMPADIRRTAAVAARGRGDGLDQPRNAQRRHRGAAAGATEDREEPREPHLHQARRPQPGRGGADLARAADARSPEPARKARTSAASSACQLLQPGEGPASESATAFSGALAAPRPRPCQPEQGERLVVAVPASWLIRSASPNAPRPRPAPRDRAGPARC